MFPSVTVAVFTIITGLIVVDVEVVFTLVVVDGVDVEVDVDVDEEVDDVVDVEVEVDEGIMVFSIMPPLFPPPLLETVVVTVVVAVVDVDVVEVVDVVVVDVVVVTGADMVIEDRLTLFAVTGVEAESVMNTFADMVFPASAAGTSHRKVLDVPVIPV